MSTWLQLLRLEIQEVDALIEPTEEVGEGETVVGVVSDELKKLWTLAKGGKKAAEILEVELKYSPASVEERARVAEQMGKAKALEMLFWIGVMDDWKLWGHPEQCGLRVGWRVVELKQRELPFPFNLFPGGQQ